MDSPGDVYERGVTDDDAEVVESIDCYVLASRTYELALQLGWPYGSTATVVVTSKKLPSTRESVEFYSGDLKRLVGEILAPRYGNIWLVGGALGDGLHLFGDSGTEQRWNLKNVVAYKNGFVELSYSRQSSGAIRATS
jgi:hypothetical protein